MNLALCYRCGNGVRIDIKEAVRWYKAAAAQGNMKAKYNLACSLEDGWGVKQDKNEALRLFQAGADQNDLHALMRLSELSLSGSFASVGYGKDVHRAKRLHKRVRKLCRAGNIDKRAQEWLEKFSRDHVDTLLACDNENCNNTTTTGVDGSERTVKLRACSGCMKVHYCCVECQRDDWNMRHKAVCKKP